MSSKGDFHSIYCHLRVNFTLCILPSTITVRQGSSGCEGAWRRPCARSSCAWPAASTRTPSAWRPRGGIFTYILSFKGDFHSIYCHSSSAAVVSASALGDFRPCSRRGPGCDRCLPTRAPLGRARQPSGQRVGRTAVRTVENNAENFEKWNGHG